MKKTLTLFACLAFSLPAAALPERADFLIRSMISKTSPLAPLVDQILQTKGRNFDAVYDSIKIQAANSSPQLRALCQEYSRSAAFLKVEIDFGNEAKSYFFSTRETSGDLKLCPNQ